MLFQAVSPLSPVCTQVRHMATLRDISNRLKAVTNIQKITKSMKIVSAAKFSQAEKALRPARPYGEGAKAFYEKADVTSDEKKTNHLIIALTSDRGLCGAIHSSIVRTIRAKIAEQPDNVTTKIIPIGDKSKAMLQRQHGDKILMHFTEIGKKVASFGDASTIARAILELDYEYDHAELYFNTFKTVVSYKTTALPIYTLNQVSNAGKISLYDSLDEDVLRSYNEFSLASLIYFAMKEASASEQSARMTAMDGASKNAGEMIDSLTMLYNRSRQAVITRELIEIISGAAALK